MRTLSNYIFVHLVLLTACGSSSSENNTYWTQPGTVSSGTCALTLCPSSDAICSVSYISHFQYHFQFSIPFNTTNFFRIHKFLNICTLHSIILTQIRLDFSTFVITGPSSRTAMTVSRLFGNVAGSITSEIAGATRAGNCLTDSFSVQGASASTNPPVVCGTLTGQHGKEIVPGPLLIKKTSQICLMIILLNISLTYLSCI